MGAFHDFLLEFAFQSQHIVIFITGFYLYISSLRDSRTWSNFCRDQRFSKIENAKEAADNAQNDDAECSLLKFLYFFSVMIF